MPAEIKRPAARLGLPPDRQVCGHLPEAQEAGRVGHRRLEGVAVRRQHRHTVRRQHRQARDACARQGPQHPEAVRVVHNSTPSAAAAADSARATHPVMRCAHSDSKTVTEDIMAQHLASRQSSARPGRRWCAACKVRCHRRAPLCRPIPAAGPPYLACPSAQPPAALKMMCNATAGA